MPYKICRFEKQKNKSATYNGRCVIYKINKWSKPSEYDGPLAVFDTYENTLNFLTKLPISTFCYKIYKCKIKLDVHNQQWFYDYSPTLGHNKTFYGPSPEYQPIGTILANEVMITKLKLIQNIKEANNE